MTVDDHHCSRPGVMDGAPSDNARASVRPPGKSQGVAGTRDTVESNWCLIRCRVAQAEPGESEEECQ
jgi:hypothetical protein